MPRCDDAKNRFDPIETHIHFQWLCLMICKNKFKLHKYTHRYVWMNEWDGMWLELNRESSFKRIFRVRIVELFDAEKSNSSNTQRDTLRY